MSCEALRLCRSDGDIPRPAAQETAVASVRKGTRAPRNGAVVYVLERRLFDALFAKHQPLGSGEEGVVDLYTCSRSPTCVAVKRIDRDSDMPVRLVKAFAHEIHMHAVATVAAARRGFGGIVPLLGMVVDRTADGITFPLMSIMPVYRRGTLENELDEAARYLRADRRHLLHQRRWAEGDRILEWLHDVARIVHGDAHLGNWFIGDDGRLVLGDFGRAQCDNVDLDFRAACVYERTEFAFSMARHGGDKWKLGAQLGALERKRRW